MVCLSLYLTLGTSLIKCIAVCAISKMDTNTDEMVCWCGCCLKKINNSRVEEQGKPDEHQWTLIGSDSRSLQPDFYCIPLLSPSAWQVWTHFDLLHNLEQGTRVRCSIWNQFIQMDLCIDVEGRAFGSKLAVNSDVWMSSCL